MYGSKKQFWILEMIKGADLVPAGAGGPGRYRPKERMVLTMEGGDRLAIGPDDVLDFSSDEKLGVETAGRMVEACWNSIARIDFEAAAPSPVYKAVCADAGRRWMGLPADKKAG